MLLPTKKTPFVSGATSLFDALVRIGEERAQVTLPHPLHAFLVRCLVEHLRDVEITHQVLALALLTSPHMRGTEAVEHLRRVGDAALLLAGLFPERARRLNVDDSYFHQVGKTAYRAVAGLLVRGHSDPGTLFNSVAEGFDALALVLDASRERRQECHWADVIHRAQA